MVKFVDFDEIRVMIVEFSVKNFRSIKELQTISFVATKLKSNQEKHPDVDKNNIVEVGGMRLLKTVGIYGANASGKSNVVKALEYFLLFIKQQPQAYTKFPEISDPFLYEEECLNQETYFQIVIIGNNRKFRYGFTIKKVFKPNYAATGFVKRYEILNEWLFGPKEKNQGKYFTRNRLEINKDQLPNGESIPDLQHEHNLFLSHAASYDKGVCYEVLENLVVKSMSALSENLIVTFSLDIILGEGKSEMLKFLSAFDLNYSNIDTSDGDIQLKYGRFSLDSINFIKTDRNGKQTSLNLIKNESMGTRKIFELAGYLMNIFDNESKINRILIIDEIDSNFHPSLLIKLIKMFNDPTINKSGAQLLFTSHDTNLLDPSIMRRDQFYFTEKDEQEATKLYSLADLRGIRNDADFAKQYLAGYYGAVPSLKDYSLEKESENG